MHRGLAHLDLNLWQPDVSCGDSLTVVPAIGARLALVNSLSTVDTVATGHAWGTLRPAIADGLTERDTTDRDHGLTC
jgi:hypothetical protein